MKTSVAIAVRLAFLFTALTLVACAPTPVQESEHASSGSTQSEPLDVAGTWRAVLTSPGGELPFRLEIRQEDLPDEADGPMQANLARAWVVNDTETVHASHVDLGPGRRVRLRFDWYDSEIEAELDTNGTSLDGRWRKTSADGDSTLAFHAERVNGEEFRRFAKEPQNSTANASASVPLDVAGDWRVEFTDDSGSEMARGEFRQEGERVTGTFLTPTGDYRFLEGEYRDGSLRLSTFDGAHAFLFHARATDEATLEGDFWSRDSYHATWQARRLQPALQSEPNGESETTTDFLPDAWSQVGLNNNAGRFDFTFPNLDGEPVSLSDPRFDGKVVVVNIFGSWCPNCNDEAPLLAQWHEQYRDQGLEIVGLAYELRGDPERDREMVRRFAQRYDLRYPLLLAGTSDKQAAAATLPDLTDVLAFPTTIFVGRDGRVRQIHSGFSGPGTGHHHEQLVSRLQQTLESLLAEPAPPSEEDDA